MPFRPALFGVLPVKPIEGPSYPKDVCPNAAILCRWNQFLEPTIFPKPRRGGIMKDWFAVNNLFRWSPQPS